MLLVAHRGASEYEPENTLLAFRRGLELGANAVEFDVRATKDNRIVVIHDSEVDRTTNGKGKVSDFTLEELKKLDAGKGEKIPTLQGALNAMYGKCTILIELKDKDLEKEVVNIVKDLENILVISFDAESVKKVKQLAPDIKTGLIFGKKIRNIQGFLKLGKAIQVDWLLGKSDIVDETLIEEAHKWKFKILVWVLNTKKSMQQYAVIGADGIASDMPDLFENLSNF